MEEFPTRLRRLRERRGLSRKIFGQLCGLSRNSIERYERGEREPTLTALLALADFLDISLDELSGRETVRR